MPSTRRMFCALSATILVVLWLTHPLLSAPEPRLAYSLREWHAEDGLLNDVVYDIAQDKEGYLWLSTASGITRFDGTRFEKLKLEHGFKPGRSGTALVTTQEQAVLFADPEGVLWKTTAGNPSKLEHPRFNNSQSIVLWMKQSSGVLWASTGDGTLFRLESSGFVESTLDREDAPKRLRSWAEDKEQNMWVADTNDLYKITAKGTHRIANSWGSNEIRITSSKQGTPWIAVGTTIGRWNGSNLEPLLSVPEQFGAHYIRCMLEDSQGALWIGTRSRGIYRVVGNEYELVPTSNKSINSLLEDREGNLWVGTGGGGLNRLQVKTSYLFASNSGLRDDVCLSVCEDNAGWIWLANRDGGFARIKNNTVEVMSGQPGWPFSTGNRAAIDTTGRLWMNGGDCFFYRDQFSDACVQVTAVTIQNMRCLFPDRDNRLWIAGGSGEFGYLENDRYHDIPLPTAASSEQVTCITQTLAGELLVGTTNGRLLRFTESQLKPFFTPALDQFFPVRAILSDTDGSLWIATSGAGLRIIRAGQEHQLNKEQGLPDSFVSQLLFDDFGGVWLGSPRGIFRMEKRKVLDVIEGRSSYLQATSFGKNEGLQPLPCLDGYQPNSCKSRDGRLWFTTRTGVVSIDPKRIIPVGPRPVHINGLQIDDKPVTLAKSVHIPSDAHKIEFRYSVIDLTAPERPYVRYRLDGFDQEWIPGEADRKIVYPRLPPGKYTLHVSVVDHTDDEPAEGSSLALVIVPFWWQTDTFRAAVASLLFAASAMILHGIYKRRYSKRLEKAQYETMLSEERTRIARDIHDELGASLTQISLLSQSAPSTDIPEHHRSHFDQIYTTTSAITRSIDEIVWAIDARHDNLDSLVCYFSNFAQSFLGASRIRCRLDSKGDHPDLVVNSRVRHNLFLAFKESLNNCVKHSQANEVVIRIATTDSLLSILITDNGKGLQQTATEEGNATKKRIGTGLKHLPVRMAAIQGQGIVRPVSSGGTEVELTIPLAKLDK